MLHRCRNRLRIIVNPFTRRGGMSGARIRSGGAAHVSRRPVSQRDEFLANAARTNCSRRDCRRSICGFATGTATSSESGWLISPAIADLLEKLFGAAFHGAVTVSRFCWRHRWRCDWRSDLEFYLIAESGLRLSGVKGRRQSSSKPVVEVADRRQQDGTIPVKRDAGHCRLAHSVSVLANVLEPLRKPRLRTPPGRTRLAHVDRGR